MVFNGNMLLGERTRVGKTSVGYIVKVLSNGRFYKRARRIKSHPGQDQNSKTKSKRLF